MALAGGGTSSKWFLVRVRRSRPCPRLASPILPWERLPSRCYLPWLMTTLTANAARDLLAVVPDSTGTIGAAAETIETVTRGALAAGRGVEPAFADACQMGASDFELVHAIVRDLLRLYHDLRRFGHAQCMF